MSKIVKRLMIDEYSSRYGSSANACLINVIGLDAVTTNQLRGRLRSKNMHIQVLKNRLARKAFEGTPLEALGRGMAGPCAMVTGDGTAIDLAKVLVDLQKDFPAIELKLGLLDGDVELVDVTELARMKSRDELLADLAGLIQGPAGALAACLTAPGGRLAGCLETIAEKQQADESA